VERIEEDIKESSSESFEESSAEQESRAEMESSAVHESGLQNSSFGSEKSRELSCSSGSVSNPSKFEENLSDFYESDNKQKPQEVVGELLPFRLKQVEPKLKQLKKWKMLVHARFNQMTQLLEKPQRPNLQNIESVRRTLVKCIYRRKPKDLLMAIFLYGGQLNQVAVPDGSTFLTLACALGEPECVRVLLQSGAQPNLKDSNGILPIHYAAYSKNKKVFELLVEFGANEKEIDGYGRLPWQGFD